MVGKNLGELERCENRGDMATETQLEECSLVDQCEGAQT